MSSPDKNSELFIRWINKDLTEEELREIESDPTYKEYNTILNEVDQWELPALNKEEGYKALISRRTKTRAIQWYQTKLFKMAAAFALIAVALAWFFVSNRSVVTNETGIAETKEVTLPDGSVVHLGPSSKLAYNARRWEISRNLKLYGTGYFEVVHGTPFKVNIRQGSVEVLGTSFEIKSRKDFASVSCFKGKVKVSAPDTAVVLTPGIGVKMTPAKDAEVFHFSDLVWSPDVTKFYSAPLSAVLESLEVQFNIKIKAKDIDVTRAFTGSYTHKDVTLALKMVCEPMNVEYEVNGNTVTLR